MTDYNLRDCIEQSGEESLEMELRKRLNPELFLQGSFCQSESCPHQKCGLLNPEIQGNPTTTTTTTSSPSQCCTTMQCCGNCLKNNNYKSKNNNKGNNDGAIKEQKTTGWRMCSDGSVTKTTTTQRWTHVEARRRRIGTVVEEEERGGRKEGIYTGLVASSSPLPTSSSMAPHRTSSSSLLVLLSLLCFLSCAAALPTKQRDHRITNFADPRQDELVKSLSSYRVIIPSKVSVEGEFLSSHLPHFLPAHHRAKRWADTAPATNTNTRNADDATNFNSANSEANTEDKSKDSNDALNSGKEVHYQLHIEGEGDVHITMRPNHRLVAPSAVVERHRAGGNLTHVKIRPFHKQDLCHFVGQVKGHDRSKVALETCNGLHGYIHTAKDQYFIEPVRGHDPRSPEGHPHIIYKRSAIIGHPYNTINDNERDKGTCGVGGEESSADDERERWENTTKPTRTSENPARRKKRSISLERNVETLVVVDKDMMEYYKDDNIETYVLTIMNMVASMYHDFTIGNAVNLVLVRMMLLEENPKDLEISHHADNTLSSFCKWQSTVNIKDDKDSHHHDVAILLTRKNICARLNEPCSTLGLAQVSGLCQIHRSCNINEDTGLSLAYTVAHELGHNFGMQHDGASNGCDPNPTEHIHIMAPQLSARPNPVYWSTCSRDAITRFLDRDWGRCTNDEPSDHQFEFPVLPPGVMYDVDHQCRLQFGPDAKHCEGIDEPCSTLWCKVNNRCLTKLEASAPGTLCGENKWCFNNKCEMIMEKPEAIDGEWGVWGGWSSCTRTCGAGVAYKERHCNNPPPSRGGNYCLGERKRYRICNTDQCPPSDPSFRAVQCSSFNDEPYKGKLYEWEPVNTPGTPCQLHCKPHGKFFSVMKLDNVVDGTPCQVPGRDMCIGGRPRHVGCDWKIDSVAREDICGICHGDGTSCKNVTDQYNKTEGLGYENAFTLPEGARNIRVEEVAEANNYLAVRNTKGQYFLNGHWFIQWSGDYEAAGTIIHYKRDGNKESFVAQGPLKEPLQIMLLFQSKNPGITFNYTIPNENMTDIRTPEYHWQLTDWTHCTASCGGGTQRSEVVCVEVEAGLVENRYCNASTKRDDLMRSCNTHRCPARWWRGPWQRCSATCGPQFPHEDFKDLTNLTESALTALYSTYPMHRRTVLCIRAQGEDNQIALDESDCASLEKPSSVEPCRHLEPCSITAEWQVSDWLQPCNGDPCSTQMRRVMCSDTENPQSCDASSMPASERKCTNITCGVWQAKEWSQCTSDCGGGTRFRGVMCVGGLACFADAEPASEEQCNMHDCNSINPLPPTPPRRGYGTYSDMFSDGNNNGTTDEGIVVVAQDGDSNTAPQGERSRSNVTSNNIFIPDGDNSGSKDSVPVGKIEVTMKRTTVVHTTAVPTTAVPTTAVPKTTTTKNVPRTTTMPEVTTHIPEVKTPSPHHKWIPLFWDKCSQPCDGGSRNRAVMCINTRTLAEEGERACEGHTKPETMQSCNTEPCLQWTAGIWSECSSSCGPGTRSRPVSCPKNRVCIGERPHEIEPCETESCAVWLEGPWSQCSASCDEGQQVRHVECVDRESHQPALDCDPTIKPNSTTSCEHRKCEETQAASASMGFSCRANILSKQVCKALKRMGRCRQMVVQYKCCRTCFHKHNQRSLNKSKAFFRNS